MSILFAAWTTLSKSYAMIYENLGYRKLEYTTRLSGGRKDFASSYIVYTNGKISGIGNSGNYLPDQVIGIGAGDLNRIKSTHL